MSRAEFQLQTGPEPTPVEVTVTGEVDASNVVDFDQSVRELPGARPMILHLSSVKYLDSAGFAALHRIVAGHAVAIALPAHSPLRKAAVLMGLPHHDNAEDAAATLDSGAAGGGRRNGG